MEESTLENCTAKNITEEAASVLLPSKPPKPKKPLSEKQKAALIRRKNKMYKRAQRRREQLAKTGLEVRAQKTHEEAASESYDFPDVCKKDEAKDILRDHRNLSKGYIVDAAYALGTIAAKRLRIPANRFFWTNGVLSTLESIQTQNSLQLLPSVEDAKAENEVFRNQDQLALWDFACSWREQEAKKDHWGEGHKITFEEYQALRALKGDPCKLGNTFLDRDFEALHEEWQDFFPRICINALSENYSQREMKQVMSSLAEIYDYLCMAFRGSFKTTWMVSYLLCWCCTFYDIRILVASATTPLSKDTVKSFRKHFILENEDLTLFQQIFAEMNLYTKDDEGSVLTYQCPCARLNLAQATMFSVGLDSTVAGRRADIILADDLSDNSNSDTPELRATTQRKWELMTELREGGNASFVFMLGTPYALGDLLWTVINRNSINTTKSVAVKLDPCLELIDEGRRRELLDKPELWHQVQEHEVKMRFPTQFGWAQFKKSLSNNELKTVLQQKLLVFTSDGDVIRLNFEREQLDAAIVERAPNPDADIHQVLMTVDRAHSTKMTADRSAISLTQFHKNSIGQPAMCVLHNRADRWPTSELAKQIVDTWVEYKPYTIVIEKDNAWQDLATSLQLECDRRNVTLNIYWRPTTQTPRAKIIRFKGLEGLLGASPRRLTFVRGPWIEDTFAEFLWQDGIRVSSTGKQKDDRLDCISTASLFLPGLITAEEADKTQEDKEAEDRRAAMRAQHEMIFGGGTHSNVSSGRAWREGMPTTESPPPDVGENVTRGAYGIPGLRGWKQPAPEPNKKLMSFGDIQPKHF